MSAGCGRAAHAGSSIRGSQLVDDRVESEVSCTSCRASRPMLRTISAAPGGVPLPASPALTADDYHLTIRSRLETWIRPGSRAGEGGGQDGVEGGREVHRCAAAGGAGRRARAWRVCGSGSARHPADVREPLGDGSRDQTSIAQGCRSFKTRERPQRKDRNVSR